VKRHFSNGLGVMLLVIIMGLTPLIPAAVSAPEPKWVWDDEGKVHDANSNYRTLTDEEACAMYGFCREIHPRFAVSSGLAGADGPGDLAGLGGDSGGR
jgi:hypothetical protein